MSIDKCGTFSFPYTVFYTLNAWLNVEKLVLSPKLTARTPSSLMTRYPSWSGIRSRPAVRAAVVWKTNKQTTKKQASVNVSSASEETKLRKYEVSTLTILNVPCCGLLSKLQLHFRLLPLRDRHVTTDAATHMIKPADPNRLSVVLLDQSSWLWRVEAN